MSNRGKWLRFIIAAVAVAWLLRFPPTRAVIVWLLPFGSGWDDLVQMALLALVVVVFLVKNLRYGKSLKARKSALDDFFQD